MVEGWVLLVQLPGWRPMVWLGCAAVLAQAPKLTLMWLRVPALVPVLARGARPLPGLLRQELLQQGLLRSVPE